MTLLPDVIMRSRMVRDVGHRLLKSVSFIAFVEKPGVPQFPMGHPSHETPKTIQATV